MTLAVIAPPPPTGTGGGMGGGGGNAGPANVGGARGKGKGGTGVGSYPPGTKIPANVPPLVRPPDMPGTRGLPGTLGGAPDSRPTAPQLPTIGVAPREGDLVNVVSVEAFDLNEHDRLLDSASKICGQFSSLGDHRFQQAQAEKHGIESVN